MKTHKNPIGSLSAKLIAALIIVVCLTVGAIGLMLPIIPGLLFLAIAAVVIAKNFPLAGRALRKNPRISEYLDSADGLDDLPVLQKIQLGGLLCIKVLIESVAAVTSFVTAFLRDASAKERRY